MTVETRKMNCITCPMVAPGAVINDFVDPEK